jgi:hypothetical protein
LCGEPYSRRPVSRPRGRYACTFSVGTTTPKGEAMSSMRPRSHDDYAAFFALAQLHGYPLPLWDEDENRRSRRRPGPDRPKHRRLSSRARFPFGNRPALLRKTSPEPDRV